MILLKWYHDMSFLAVTPQIFLYEKKMEFLFSLLGLVGISSFSAAVRWLGFSEADFANAF